MPKSAHGIVAPLVRSIFEPDAESAWAQHARVVEQLTGRFDAAAELLAEAGPEILAFTAFPKAHHKQLRSNNPLERLNKEIRRRTDVVGIFPNRAAPGSGWSARSWPSSKTNGRSPAATCPQTR